MFRKSLYLFLEEERMAKCLPLCEMKERRGLGSLSLEVAKNKGVGERGEKQVSLEGPGCSLALRILRVCCAGGVQSSLPQTPASYPNTRKRRLDGW